MCRNASPLSVHRQDGNQAVSIVIDSNNLTSPPESYERNWSENYRYICQYPVISPTIQAPSATLNSIAAHTRSIVHPSLERTKSAFDQTLPSVVSLADSASTDFVAFDSSKLITGLIIGGIALFMTSVLLYFLIRKGCYKSSINVNNYNSDSFHPQNVDNNVREVKENPLYGRSVRGPIFFLIFYEHTIVFLNSFYHIKFYALNVTGLLLVYKKLSISRVNRKKNYL